MSVKLRRFLSVILFCVLLVGIVSVISRVQFDRFMDIWDQPGDYPYEVLWVGSSHIYRSIIPQMLYDDYGLATYSATTPGQTSYHALSILKDYPNWESLKLVVLDLFSFLRPYTYSEDYNHSLSSTNPEMLSPEMRQNRFNSSTASIRQMPEYDVRKYIRMFGKQEVKTPLQYYFAMFRAKGYRLCPL